jgi:hypothetical protein
MPEQGEEALKTAMLLTFETYRKDFEEVTAKIEEMAKELATAQERRNFLQGTIAGMQRDLETRGFLRARSELPRTSRPGLSPSLRLLDAVASVLDEAREPISRGDLIARLRAMSARIVDEVPSEDGLSRILYSEDASSRGIAVSGMGRGAKWSRRSKEAAVK